MQDVRIIKDTLVVIVIYNKPVDDVLRSVLPFSSDRHDIFIYDNSFSHQSINKTNVTYVHDPKNGGVSAAYNAAHRFALTKDKNWMLLLDHDTICTSQYLEELTQSVNQHPNSRIFVPRLSANRMIISPFRWMAGRGWRTKVKNGSCSLARYRFANSGMLVRCDTFKAIGGYPEKIKLDFADIAFGERLLKVTDHFIVVDAELKHDFADHVTQQPGIALQRFKQFCSDAHVVHEELGNSVLLRLHTLLRACRLSLQHKDLSFLKNVLSATR